MRWIVLALAFFAASPAFAERFVVCNKMPPTFVVVNRVPPPRVPDPPIVRPAVRPTIVTTYRAPLSHTHTCPRCGTTWDHAANGGHNCANCGTLVLVQDRSPRMVAVKKVVNVPVTATPAPRPPQTAPQSYQDFQQLMPQIRVNAGCPPGG